MKDPFERTKAVVRQLPPTLSHSDFFLQIDDRFGGRYTWSCFRPGKISHKQQRHARAYINFNTPKDVLEFAEFFNGHVFVNEKGAQYKATVEYAPSQRTPRLCTKKDGREGTIYKDPDYLDFLKLIATPAEHLPSAEIQLERKEAEQAGTAKESPIVTPLMEFVRQRRAADSGTHGKSVVGKVSRRGAASLNKSSSTPTKRSSEKKKYILKENAKGSSRKEKSSFITVARQGGQSTTTSGKEISEVGHVPGIEGPVSGIPLTIDSGKKKILLLKGKEREMPQVADGVSQQVLPTAAGNSPSTTKHRQRREAGGKLIRSILLSNDVRQSTSAVLQKNPNINVENGKRPPRSNPHSGLNDHVSGNKPNAASSDGIAKKASENELMKDSHHLSSLNEKAEKRTKNRDRPDRGVWAPLRRSDVLQSNQDSSLSMLQSSEGSSRHYGRRGFRHTTKDDASFNSSDAKSSRRGGTGGHAHSEKQVWIQKPSSGS